MLVLVALAACGDNTAPVPGGEARSGARLVLERYVYADGTDEVAPGRFFDTARDEHCAPAVWSDGQTVCTPDAGEVVYADADCAQMLGRVAEAVPAPEAVRRGEQEHHLAAGLPPQRL